ncbi:MAG: universal stress protein [Candidatus Methylomirabilia bacterium]
MRKMLIGIHDKNCSLRAVSYVMKQYPKGQDLDVTFVHVFPNLPAMYWDDGHILNSKEIQERKKVIDTLMAKQREFIEPIIEGAMNELVEKGFARERVHMKFILGSADIADSLLDEAAQGKQDTIVVGRCGIADGEHLIAGGFVTKLIHQAAGIAICVVQ